MVFPLSIWSSPFACLTRYTVSWYSSIMRDTERFASTVSDLGSSASPDANPQDTTLVIENLCAPEKIDLRYRPLIAAIIAISRIRFPQTTAMYLLGSVPRGDAVYAIADIDLVTLVSQEPTPAERRAFAEDAAHLSRDFPFVPRFDLEVSKPESLTAFQHFVLASDALMIWGDDPTRRAPQRISRQVLVELVTPDAAALIAAYRKAILALTEDAGIGALNYYSRVIGKDLLKCLRATAILRGSGYERSIAAIHAQIQHAVPESISLADRLYRCYRDPSVERTMLLSILDDAQHVLVPRFNGTES